MTANDQKPPVYGLADGVRVFRSGEEIRFRRGVWSHQEATLRLTGQARPVVNFLNAVYEALAEGNDADPAAIGGRQGASPEELLRYYGLLESLKEQQFLRDTRQKSAVRAVSALLGGSGGLGGFEEQIAPPRVVMFFSDNEYARNSARALAAEIGLPLDVVEDEVLQGLATADLTSRTDAVEYMEAVAKYEKVFQPYSCVLGCVAAPNLTVLRNLNRLLIRAEKPLILGLIDGPFIAALSTHATETGCFECFEQRMLARLEDTAVYQQFVQATAGINSTAGAWLAPQLHMLVSTVISEGYLYSTVGLMRLAGRIVNVYLPLLEIQVQDLLRVPYCPACGYISKAQMNEMYTSTKRLVTDMMSKIKVEG